jgi:hypothetical protein
MKQLYVHIGTHKTGSTSVQRWMSERREFLGANGYGLYRGLHNESNHTELFLATMRPDRDSFAKLSLSDVSFDEGYMAMVADRVQAFIHSAPQSELILTSEGLSLLRHPDEIERLAGVFGGDYDRIKIILFLRNPKDYLESYRLQLRKKKGRVPSADYWSALYVEDDTWLTNYQQLIDVYGEGFGRENVHVIDYDQEMEREGNVIPSFLRAIGLEIEADERDSLSHYKDNATLSRNEA